MWGSRIAIVSLVTLLACADSSTEVVDEDESFESPHTCVGASLRVQTDASLDIDSLVTFVEDRIPALECFSYDALRVVECIPLNSSCGFEPTAKAVAFEKQFLGALRDFDASLAEYPYSVIDECFCRAY